MECVFYALVSENWEEQDIIHQKGKKMPQSASFAF
jgi:hypothetical protein